MPSCTIWHRIVPYGTLNMNILCCTIWYHIAPYGTLNMNMLCHMVPYTVTIILHNVAIYGNILHHVACGYHTSPYGTLTINIYCVIRLLIKLPYPIILHHVVHYGTFIKVLFNVTLCNCSEQRGL